MASADSSKMRGIGGVGTMEPVLYGRRLWMGGGSVLVPVWRSVGDGFTGKGELDLWVARAGNVTAREPPCKQNGLPYIVISCSLLMVKT